MATVLPEVYEALRSIDIAEDKALRIAAVLSERRAHPGCADTAKRHGVFSDGDAVAKLKADSTITLAMAGLMLALQVASLVRLFVD
jgi:hypothetical protein